MSSSGERTRKKASQAMYNELASNVRNNHSVAPIKKNGYTYNSMGITKYSAATTNSNQTAISKYSSYAERMELKRGKQFSNSAINGTENLKYDIRAGNLLQVQYKQDVYHAPLIATGDLDSSNGKIMKSDFIPYGETLTYPGFITDYSNSIFKTTGIGGSSNQQQAWVRNLTSIQHTGSHHWNKLNADEQMTGFSLTSPIQLWSAFDLNITANPTDVSGYIFNGTHRKGIIKGAVNPTLYYEIHDHINFNVDVGDVKHTMFINTADVSGSANKLMSSDISNNVGIYNETISWNPKSEGVFYYDCSNHHTVMGGKIVIGGGGGGGAAGAAAAAAAAGGGGYG